MKDPVVYSIVYSILYSIVYSIVYILVVDLTPSNFKIQLSYRVFFIKGPKVIAYCSKNKGLRDFQSLLGAHQMWSI